ncbi:MAG: response regulator [Caldilineaceae bacterium]|nr:response regulator [Caldilineaceae bacterium]HRJ43232.1 response regulator [Caldilineaceae bacterium]
MPGVLENGNGTANSGYVLVVDDEPLLCRMVSAMLMRAGYDTQTATNGRDALQRITQRLPDIVTLDVMMPDMSGIEVARQMRSNPQTAGIPIIFVTALDRSVSMDLRRFIEEPDVYHVDKPFSREQLLMQITIALQAKESRITA